MATELGDDARQRVEELRRSLRTLVPEYDRALKARNELKNIGARKRIFKRLDALDQSIGALKVRIQEKRIEFDKAKKCRKNRTTLPVTRTARPSAYTERTHNRIQANLLDLAGRLREAARRRAELDETLDSDMEWNRVSFLFYDIRHQLLKLVAELDGLDEERTERKRGYLIAAGLSLPLNAVWSDATSLSPREVNLFYGGTETPDGVGHGHIILVRTGTNTYVSRYDRKPHLYEDLKDLVG